MRDLRDFIQGELETDFLMTRWIVNAVYENTIEWFQSVYYANIAAILYLTFLGSSLLSFIAEELDPNNLSDNLYWDIYFFIEEPFSSLEVYLIIELYTQYVLSWAYYVLLTLAGYLQQSHYLLHTVGIVVLGGFLYVSTSDWIEYKPQIKKFIKNMQFWQ